MKTLAYMFVYQILMPPGMLLLGFGIGYTTAWIRGWINRRRKAKKAVQVQP